VRQWGGDTSEWRADGEEDRTNEDEGKVGESGIAQGDGGRGWNEQVHKVAVTCIDGRMRRLDEEMWFSRYPNTSASTA